MSKLKQAIVDTLTAARDFYRANPDVGFSRRDTWEDGVLISCDPMWAAKWGDYDASGLKDPEIAWSSPSDRTGRLMGFLESKYCGHDYQSKIAYLNSAPFAFDDISSINDIDAKIAELTTK